MILRWGAEFPRHPNMGRGGVKSSRDLRRINWLSAAILIMKIQSISVNPVHLGVFLLLASTSCKKGNDAKPEETPLSSFVKGDASLAITIRTSGP